MIGVKRFRQRRHGVCLMAFAAVALVMACPPPATAQSFFQNLFGFITPKTPSKPPSRRMRRPQKSVPWVGSEADREAIRKSRRDRQKRQARTNRYRTMCVRTCDGFYFPISSSVQRHRLKADEKSCRARCAGWGRLFVLPEDSTDMAQMEDLSGVRYADLKTAFLYRKTLKDGCTCRPMPWSAAERARHKRYEVYEAYMKLQARRDAVERERRARVAAQSRKAAPEAGADGLADQGTGRAVDDHTAGSDQPVPWIRVSSHTGSEPPLEGQVEMEAAQAGMAAAITGAGEPSADAARNAQVNVSQQARKTSARTAKRRRISRSKASQSRRKRTAKTTSQTGFAGLFGGSSGAPKSFGWPGDR